jgi:hypothetical protein
VLHHLPIVAFHDACISSKVQHLCRSIKQDGVQVIVDKVSLEFLRGSTIEYAEDLISSNFQVGHLRFAQFLLERSKIISLHLQSCCIATVTTRSVSVLSRLQLSPDIMTAVS